MAADVREGGRWSLAQRAKNDVLYLLAASAVALTSRLPSPLLRALGRGLGTLAWHTVRSARAIALRNHTRVFPSLAEAARRAELHAVYRALGEHLGDTVALLAPRRQLPTLPFLPGAREVLDAAIAEGRGVLFASAHLGPWERVAGSLVASGVPITVVAREAYDPRLTRLYERLRDRRGVRTVYRGAAGAGIALVRVLRRGEVLGIPMDLASRVPSVDAPLLGHPAPTPVGPARIALRTGAAVVVGTAAPRPAGHGGKVPEAPIDATVGIEVRRIRTDDLAPDADGERALTARINAELGARILALPHGWVWMHDRWRPL